MSSCSRCPAIPDRVLVLLLLAAASRTSSEAMMVALAKDNQDPDPSPTSSESQASVDEGNWTKRRSSTENPGREESTPHKTENPAPDLSQQRSPFNYAPSICMLCAFHFRAHYAPGAPIRISNSHVRLRPHCRLWSTVRGAGSQNQHVRGCRSRSEVRVVRQVANVNVQ